MTAPITWNRYVLAPATGLALWTHAVWEIATNDVRTPTITKQTILTRPVLTPMARAARALPPAEKTLYPKGVLRRMKMPPSPPPAIHSISPGTPDGPEPICPDTTENKL